MKEKEIGKARDVKRREKMVKYFVIFIKDFSSWIASSRSNLID